MSASLDLPDADWRTDRADRCVGARGARRQSGRWSPAGTPSRASRGASERAAQPVHRPPAADDRRGAWGGVRVQPRLLGQLPRRGRGRRRSAPPVSGSASSPTRFAWALEPGASFTTPEAVIACTADGLGGLSRHLPRALPRATRPRGLARPTAADPHQQLGGRPTSTSMPTSWSPSRPRRASSASSCSCSTTAGSAPATTTRPRWATGSSTGASCPTAWMASPARITGAWASTSGSGSSPRWSAAESDLFRAHPDWAIGIPGRPRTESRQQLVLDMGRAGGRRPPRPASWARSSRAPRSRTSSGT